MNVLVCGGRDFADRELVFRTLDDLAKNECNIVSVVTGGAKGADALAEDWSKIRQVKRIVYPAQWNLHGRAAGPMRNVRMVEEEEIHLVVAFPGGRGTRHMIVTAAQYGIEVREIPAS